MTAPVLLWLRQELRLHDHPALVAAAAAGPVIPVYILDDETPGDWRMGGAQRWWLHRSLTALAADLEALGSRLVLRRGPAAAVLAALVEDSGAGAVHATHQPEPWWRDAEAGVGALLHLHHGSGLIVGEQPRTGGGERFRAYAGWWRALAAQLPPAAPLAIPKRIAAPERWPDGDALADWNLLPTAPDWSGAFDAAWTPGEAAAREKLAAIRPVIDRYAECRDRPGDDTTSRLSPHLHFGEVSPRAVWHAVHGADGEEKFLRELAWRDFTAQVIAAVPDYGDNVVRAKHDAMAWRTGAEAGRDLKAWRRGRTGYPIVDAGMRQLWQTGWLPNRARLLTASFLVKHLLIDWREGERWYWDCLVDADYANNAFNWQWIAGSGLEAQMWSRIMAPLTQSVKYDAADYIRRWVPELAHLPDATIHDPDGNGVRPDGYPAPIVEHRAARERALAAGRAL